MTLEPYSVLTQFRAIKAKNVSNFPTMRKKEKTVFEYLKFYVIKLTNAFSLTCMFIYIAQ